MNLSFHRAWNWEGVSLELPSFGKNLLHSEANKGSRKMGDQVLVASFEPLDPAVPEADKLNYFFVCFLSQYISFSFKPLGIVFSVSCNPGLMTNTVASSQFCSPICLALDSLFP